jgi:hypothetical protein
MSKNEEIKHQKVNGNLPKQQNYHPFEQCLMSWYNFSNILHHHSVDMKLQVKPKMTEHRAKEWLSFVS